MVARAPAIPLCMFAVDGSNRTLSRSFIDSTRAEMARQCQHVGIKLAGWVSDSAPCMRKAALRHCRIKDGEQTPQHLLQHRLLQLKFYQVRGLTLLKHNISCDIWPNCPAACADAAEVI